MVACLGSLPWHPQFLLSSASASEIKPLGEIRSSSLLLPLSGILPCSGYYKWDRNYYYGLTIGASIFEVCQNKSTQTEHL